MSKEERIRVMPGYLPDGMEFVAPERLTDKMIGLGTLENQGRNDDTGLAGTLMRIHAGDPDKVAVCGVKLEDNAALVIVFDPADWPLVEPKVITAIEQHLDGSGEDKSETIDGIRIVPDADEQSLRHFVCPESMRRGAWHGIASAGMLHDPTEHGSSWLADEIHSISFVRGVLIDDRTVSVAIKDADQWKAAEHYVLIALKGALDGTLEREFAESLLCPSCREEERYGPVGTASMHRPCTCNEFRERNRARLERRLRGSASDRDSVQSGVRMGPPEALSEEQRKEVAELAAGFLTNLEESENQSRLRRRASHDGPCLSSYCCPFTMASD